MPCLHNRLLSVSLWEDQRNQYSSRGNMGLYIGGMLHMERILPLATHHG